MSEIEFVVNPKKSKPPTPIFKTSFRNVIRCFLRRGYVTGVYMTEDDKIKIYLFNVWKAFKQSWKKGGGVTLTKIITEDIEHEVMHRTLHVKCSVHPKKHEYALNIIGIGHDNKERLYE